MLNTYNLQITVKIGSKADKNLAKFANRLDYGGCKQNLCKKTKRP